MFVAFACVAKFVYISYDDRLENVYVWSRESRVAAVLFFLFGNRFLFEDRVIFISNFLFENRIVRTLRRSKTEV